jgi:hypothetical protein
MTGQVIQMRRTVAPNSGTVKLSPTFAVSPEEFWDREIADQIRLGWFGRILDVAGPVGSAMLRLHTPNRYGDCRGCGFEDLAGLGWPCVTVLAAAEAAGVAEIPGL